jgi:hypothetical protein
MEGWKGTSAPLFNPLSPDFLRDPYPHYDLLRTTDPPGDGASVGSYIRVRLIDIDKERA